MAANNLRAICFTLLIRKYLQRKQKKLKYKKRFWVRQLFKERKEKGEYHLLVKDMKLFDHEYFFKQFRMLPHKYRPLNEQHLK